MRGSGFSIVGSPSGPVNSSKQGVGRGGGGWTSKIKRRGKVSVEVFLCQIWN
jgi:hypothetical protein